MAVEDSRLLAEQRKYKRWSNEKRRARLAGRRKNARTRRKRCFYWQLKEPANE